jgi:hypothetical protein
MPFAVTPTSAPEPAASVREINPAASYRVEVKTTLYDGR